MLIPCNGRLLVKQHKKEAASSLILTTEGEEAMRLPEGDVVGVMEESTFKVGDEILFNDYAGERIIHEGVEYLLLKETEVLAKKVVC